MTPHPAYRDWVRGVPSVQRSRHCFCSTSGGQAEMGEDLGDHGVPWHGVTRQASCSAAFLCCRLGGPGAGRLDPARIPPSGGPRGRSQCTPLARHAPRPPAMHQEMWLAPSTQIAPSYWSAGGLLGGPARVSRPAGRSGRAVMAGCPRGSGRAERGVRAGVWARVRVLVTVGPTREANRPRGRAVAAACPQDPAGASARADRAQAAAHWRDT